MRRSQYGATAVHRSRRGGAGASSASETRSAAMGLPPSVVGGVEMTRRPRCPRTRAHVPVPTDPGPIPTRMTSASSRCRASDSAERTLTASRSPPKAWPAVTVRVDDRLRTTRSATRSDNASGSAAGVGHHVDHAQRLVDRLHRRRRARQLAVQRRARRPGVPSRRRGHRPSSSADAGVGLQARVPQLHDVAAASRCAAVVASGSSARRASHRCPGRARPRSC